ncbi:MAG: AAA family ATPase [Taibaiella sp.]|nr:AAA family ATPase [Taibaiella sp.]
MRINKIELKNFKRLTDLTIENIPSTAKLVLLIGANGSGKSSVFDALRFTEHRDASTLLLSYYKKDVSVPLSIKIWDQKNSPDYLYTYSDGNIDSGLDGDSFYGRTSFRHIPRLNIKALPGELSANNRTRKLISHLSDNPLFIDKDNQFERDIEIITQRILLAIFRTNTTSAGSHNGCLYFFKIIKTGVTTLRRSRIKCVNLPGVSPLQ